MLNIDDLHVTEIGASTIATFVDPGALLRRSGAPTQAGTPNAQD